MRSTAGGPGIRVIVKPSCRASASQVRINRSPVESMKSSLLRSRVRCRNPALRRASISSLRMGAVARSSSPMALMWALSYSCEVAQRNASASGGGVGCGCEADGDGSRLLDRSDVRPIGSHVALPRHPRPRNERPPAMNRTPGQSAGQGLGAAAVRSARRATAWTRAAARTPFAVSHQRSTAPVARSWVAGRLARGAGRPAVACDQAALGVVGGSGGAGGSAGSS
jgi:hypothetical protein